MIAALNMQQLARKREEQLGMLDYNLRVAQEDLVELQVSCSLAVHELMLRPDCCCLPANSL